VTAIGWAALTLVAITGTGLLLARDWRWSLGLLGAQYVGVAALTAMHWPPGMAAVKLVTGWMTTAAMGMTLTSLHTHLEAASAAWPGGRTFRAFLAGMVLLLAFAAAPRIESVVSGSGIPVAAGATVLIGLGLLHLGSSDETWRNIFALLTVLAGFEVIYAAVESSILVAGLLAVVTLGLGLVGALLVAAASTEVTA
jgi:hypothetical protein